MLNYGQLTTHQMSDQPPKKFSRQWLFQIGTGLVVLPCLGHLLQTSLFFRKAMDAGDDQIASEAAVQQGVAEGWAISAWTCPMMMVGIILIVYATVAHSRRPHRK